jgi:hypothetical protein
VKADILSGDNEVYCNTCGRKSEAEKGLQFKSFPYILTLQLKRFDFDFQRMMRVKLNDWIEFPFELNVRKYLCQDKKGPNPMPSCINANTEDVKPTRDISYSSHEGNAYNSTVDDGDTPFADRLSNVDTCHDTNSSSYQGSTNTVADGVGTAPADPTVAATHSDISRNDTNSSSCETDVNTEPVGTTSDEPTVASAHLNVNSRNSNSSNYQGNASTLTVGVSSDATVHQQSDINSSSYQGSTNTVADGVGTTPADAPADPHSYHSCCYTFRYFT